MKICAIGLRGIPEVMGGIESHCQALYPLLVEQGVAVTVIARSPYVNEKQYTYKGVKVIALFATKSKFFETFLHTFTAIIYARFKLKPDVIHLHAIGPALFAPLARLLGVKVVVTHHGADYNRAKWSPFAKKMLKLGEWCAVKCANKVIVVGKSLTESLKQEYAKQEQKFVHIPNGASISGLELASEQVLANTGLAILPGEYILAVSRLVPEKGIHDLIAAYKQSQQNKKLLIVGAADHKDAYSESLMKEASDRILFAGRRSGAELASIFKYCSLFVLPSYHEGLPIVALEAMSVNSPVLLSDIEPNMDVGLPDTCYFSTGSVTELVIKLDVNHIEYKKYSTDMISDYQWVNIAHTTQVCINGL